MNFQGKVPYQKGRDGLPVPSFLRELSLNFRGGGGDHPSSPWFLYKSPRLLSSSYDACSPQG